MYLRYDKETQSWEISRISKEEKEILVKYGVDLVLAALGASTMKEKEEEIKAHAKEAKKNTKH